MQVDSARFQHTDKYVAYLGTTAGRLRLDLAWSNMRELLPQPATGLRALDVGCGTGAFGLRLAELGFHVDLLDASDAMLAQAREQSSASDVEHLVSFHLGDAAAISEMFVSSTFDVVICHNVLEYVDDPVLVLQALSNVLQKSGRSMVSILVRNRFGEALKAAMKDGDSTSVEAALTAETVLDSLYGEPVRVFDPDDLRRTVERAGLQVVMERGVRVISDYRESSIVTEDDYERLRKLEGLLGAQPKLAAVARYTQFLAHVRYESDPRGQA
jgi:S-adenosylmethionine-dependent methyltransferase